MRNDRHKSRTREDNRERQRVYREHKMEMLGIKRKRVFRPCIRRTDEEIICIARKYTRLIDFRKNDGSIYAVALRRGLIKTFKWMNRGGDSFRWTRELCEVESRKYEGMGRSGFKKGNSPAYYASLNNGWIDSFTWLGSKQNPHKDKIYVCYKYEFYDFKAVYVGLTMNPVERDHSHRTAPNGKKSAVFKFAESNKCYIPRMTILHRHLSCEEAQDCEDFYVKKFLRLGWNVLNKARTGVGSGSIGSAAFKWTKPKVFEEAKKYSRRRHFRKGSPSAYEAARKNKWLDEMTWMPNPKDRIIKPKKEKRIITIEEAKEIASKCKTKNELMRKHKKVYSVICEAGLIDEILPIDTISSKCPVIAIDAYGNEKRFDSIKECAIYIGGYGTSINRCLRGEKLRHRGYWFKRCA